MSDRNAELNKLIWVCLDELRGTYTTEQSVCMLLVVSSIYYLNEHELSPEQKLQWFRVNQENSIVELLDTRMKQLENDNKKLKGIFTGLVTSFRYFSNSATNRALKTIINNLGSFQFNNQDELLQLINLLALRFGDVGTPEAITNLTLDLVRLENIHSFADYCSGTSSVYLEVFRRLKAMGKVDLTSYYGEEINVLSYLISKLLVLLNRVPNFNIVNKDVLDRISRDEEQKTFDFIFSDVPFGVTWNYENALNDPRYEHGIPPKSSADWAFYQNVLYHLNDNGKAIVVGTKGTLVRGSEVNIRQSIIDKDLIEAIITLPENLYSKTNISTELIIFNKRKPQNRLGKVLFIDASEYSSRINRNQHAITEEGLSKINHAYWNGTEEDRFCRLIDVEKIKSYNYSLNSKEYLDFDILKNSFEHTVKLGEIAEVRRGVQLSKEEYEDLMVSATHYFLNIKDIENGRITYDEESKITYKKKDWLVKFAIQPMDILITSKGSMIKFAMVKNPFNEAFISGNLSIIRVNPKQYNAYVLYEFLQSEVGRRMIDGLQTGTTIKLINPSRLEQLEIPLYPMEFMNEVGEKLKQNKQEYEEKIKETENKFVMQKRTLLKQLGINDKA
ncbi:Type I restriction-modification system, DNA methylase subunit [Paenibacillus tianmuensis]|uniref:site-specific DNA-methyltransferase (adenine-specific) n=1 Tax=Paenibacillus tianmuensis TaxID=624147 RepID=A0A1G4TAP0_9BACL|nr:N-6 DNA methylase [Paenibacillus tianmuensis]SCW78532.1 Type I restriction-modification system, DNA methylase subunit [Paenibacillus tianmuensis]